MESDLDNWAIQKPPELRKWKKTRNSGKKQKSRKKRNSKNRRKLKKSRNKRKRRLRKKAKKRGKPRKKGKSRKRGNGRKAKKLRKLRNLHESEKLQKSEKERGTVKPRRKRRMFGKKSYVLTFALMVVAILIILFAVFSYYPQTDCSLCAKDNKSVYRIFQRCAERTGGNMCNFTELEFVLMES